MSYETTTVAVSKSQEQIRNSLLGHGATSFNFGEQVIITGPNSGSSTIGVDFVYENTQVRMWATLAAPDVEEVEAKAKRSRSKGEDDVRAGMIEQEAMRMWRVLHWSIKTRMEAIEEGLETFEQSFLPHIVDPHTRRTLWELMRDGINDGALRVGGSGLKAIGAGR